MKILEFILYRILYPTCLIFTCILFLFAGIAASGSGRLAPTLSSMGLFLAFAFFVSLCNLILRIPKWNILIRLLLHYASLMISVFLLLFLASSNTEKTRGMLAIGILITFGYLIFGAIYAAVSSRRQKKAEKKESPEQYRQQFNKL